MWCVLEERRNGDYMKKIAIAVLSAVCVFALAGCADDVTMDNEQNDIVKERMEYRYFHTCYIMHS